MFEHEFVSLHISADSCRCFWGTSLVLLPQTIISWLNEIL